MGLVTAIRENNQEEFIQFKTTETASMYSRRRADVDATLFSTMPIKKAGPFSGPAFFMRPYLRV
jgi:hypothetical protein